MFKNGIFIMEIKGNIGKLWKITIHGNFDREYTILKINRDHHRPLQLGLQD